MDNQLYSTESELIRCNFCGTTVSTALKICPTCGNDVRPQRRAQIGLSAAILFLAVMLLTLIVGIAGEGSILRTSLQTVFNRIDTLATTLDPRLAGTATPQAVPILAVGATTTLAAPANEGDRKSVV